MRRTRGREVALQTLYQKELNPTVGARWISTFVRRRLKHTPQLLEFTKALIEGVESRKAELDERIQAISENWRLDRMPPLDRNILRLGLYEIQNGGEDTPPNVALDEAVELAKRYGTDQSGKFVNGLLDRFMPGKPPIPPPPAPASEPAEPITEPAEAAEPQPEQEPVSEATGE
jgi:N utilization substance protein B